MSRLMVWLIVFTSLLFIGCEEKASIEPDRPDLPASLPLSSVNNFEIEGNHLLAADELDDDEVVCHFMLTDGEYDGLEFDIRGRVVRLRGKSQLRLEAELPVGEMRFLYINYRGERDLPDAPLRAFGLGYLLKVTEADVTLEGEYDEEAGLVGEGTESNPYLINCDDDLLTLQGLVNNEGERYTGNYFRQTCDIDMRYVCNYMDVDYGWLPIGYTNNEPFRGFYNGAGYEIRHLRIERPDALNGGLFGCLYGAKVDSVTIVDAQVRVQAMAGAIAGCAIAAGSDNQAGGSTVSSQVSHCRVVDSRIECDVVSGGLIGMADRYARLIVNDCTIGGSNAIHAQYGSGGAVGIGVFNSYVVLQNLRNEASIRTVIGAAGGMIGTSDTLMVVDCYNTGKIEVTGDTEERFGAGGMAGGTGCGQFVNCTNKGDISGDRGVGGILGSALVDKGDGTDENPGLYNSAFFMTCINDAAIVAKSYGGGICGEAQVTAVSCGNLGNVSVSGGYAAGIVSNSPAVALLDCLNNGTIVADRMSGGMNGLAIFGTAAFCNNYGAVRSNEGYTGGIMGLGGGGAMIHYCGNYGDITVANSQGSVGGIVGELGKVREWAASDIVSVIMGSVGIITSAASLVTSSTFMARDRQIGEVGNLTDLIDKINLNKKVDMADFTFGALNIAQGVINTVLAGFDIAARVDPSSPWVEVERLKRQKAIESRSDSICHSLQMIRKASKFTFASIEQINTDQTWAKQSVAFENERFLVVDHEDKLQKFNTEIDLRRANLRETAEEDKARRDQVFDILNAVLSALSLIIFIASIPFTGGATAGVALGIVGSCLGMISGASTIGKSVMNYQVNATEVSQCYNYGRISGGENCGGIVGHLNDYGRMYDCYNAGQVLQSTAKSGLITGNVGNQVVHVNTLDLTQGSMTNSIIGSRHENPKRIEHNYRATDDEFPEMVETDYYTGWDFQTVWSVPVFIQEENNYCLPIINQSEYAK